MKLILWIFIRVHTFLFVDEDGIEIRVQPYQEVLQIANTSAAQTSSVIHRHST